MKIHTILTCYNRKELTIDGISRLYAAVKPHDISISITVVDDASTDGTALEIKRVFPEVNLLHGTGELFWNRGMFLGMEKALQDDCEYILWLNDDTQLYVDALNRMLSTEADLSRKYGKEVIIVGATADKLSGKLTYGGQVATSRFRPLTFRKVWSETYAVECETMNGNVVLIPTEIAKAVGNLDPVFEHAMGDIDYGLRVRQAGYKLFVAPGFVGHCSNNTNVGTYLDKTLPFGDRWRRMLSRKGLPVKSWLQLTRRHGGFIWPLYFVWPYMQVACQELISLIRKNTHK